MVVQQAKNHYDSKSGLITTIMLSGYSAKGTS